MGAIGNETPDQPRTQRLCRTDRDDDPASASSSGSALAADRLVLLGVDKDGTLLEVIALETDSGLLIIHAMAIRDRYRRYLKGDA